MLYEKNKMRNSYVTPNIKINSRVNDLSVIGSSQETPRNSISSELTSSSRPNSTASEDDCTEEEEEEENGDDEDEDELTSEECQTSSSEDVQRNLALETISEEASTRKRSEAEDDGDLNFSSFK